MPDMLLKRVGRAMLPANADAERKLLSLPEGRLLRSKVSLPRSGPAHRMFFAVLAAAAHHWPHGAEPQPAGDSEVLRAWLLIRAGHCDRIDFPFPDDAFGQKLALASVSDFVNRLRAKGEHPFIRTGELTDDDGQLYAVVRVFISRSMDHDHLDESEFGPIRQHCYDDIEAIVGVRVDDLARETEAA